MPNVSGPAWKTRLPEPGEYVPSSEGSIWTLSWKPAIVPSRSTTSADASSTPSATRSVPRTTATFAFAAAAATADQARSRNAGSGGGIRLPWLR